MAVNVWTPFGTVDLTDPSVILHALPFTGWVGFLADAFSGLGFLAQGAEAAVHLAPGLIEGQSFGDAFMADYGARLKIAGTVLLGGAIAGASPAVAGAMSDAVGAVQSAAANVGAKLTSQQIQIAIAKMTSDQAEKVLAAGKDALVKQLGQAQADQIVQQAAAALNQQFNQAFGSLVTNQTFVGLLQNGAKLLNATDPNTPITPDDLASIGLGPPALGTQFGVRQDVVALATNAVLHRRIYDVSTRRFDPATGAQIPPTQVPTIHPADIGITDPGAVAILGSTLLRHPDDGSRTSGTNADWALADLLAAQNAKPPQPAGVVQALQQDYTRAVNVLNGSNTNPDDILSEYLIARNRGADPSTVAGYEDKLAAATGQPSPSSAIRAAIPVGEGGAAPGGPLGFSLSPATWTARNSWALGALLVAGGLWWRHMKKSSPFHVHRSTRNVKRRTDHEPFLERLFGRHAHTRRSR